MIWWLESQLLTVSSMVLNNLFIFTILNVQYILRYLNPLIDFTIRIIV
jgi:hypothetical protein